MRRIARVTLMAVLLSAVCVKCFAAIAIEGMTKERAEKELGIVMKREFLGVFATNEVGISIEFPLNVSLKEFQFATLNIYLEWPTERQHGPVQYRRLTSVTLQPRIQTKEMVALFFTVDPEYLDKTEVTLRVRATGSAAPDGYSIRLKTKDFPSPQANQIGPAPMRVVKIVER